MGRYLNPTNDVSFRKLFGTEKHKPLLISFLNSILVLEGERKIKKVEFLSKDQAPLIKQTKTSILDIKCTDERNVQYIVEMQNKSIPAFVKRTQFYVYSARSENANLEDAKAPGLVDRKRSILLILIDLRSTNRGSFRYLPNHIFRVGGV
jgi:predicted transposase/invertase (TIGR01784 family)